MNITKKEKAIELMETLEIYEPYIEGFKESGKVCFFEGYGGFWIDQEPEIYAKMKELEKEYNALCTQSRMSLPTSGSFTTFLSYRIIRKNGMNLCTAESTSITFTPMCGTETTIVAASSER